MAFSSFRYLVQTLSSTGNDWPAVEQNLRRAHGKWGRLTNILGREGGYNRTAGRFCVAVVQAVLLFGSEIWFLTLRLYKALAGFHHRAARRMAGMVPKRHPDGTWVYPPIVAALEMVGLEEIRESIALRQNKVAQYIATCPIMVFFLTADRKPGMRLSRR